MTIAQTIPPADSWGMHGDVGAGWMVLTVVLMVLFWGAILFGAVWLVRGATRGWSTSGAPAGRESRVEILERRFAEGAISPEDYRARREVLLDGSAQPGTAGRAEARQ